MQYRESVSEILKTLCVPAHLKGYRFIVYAIELCLNDDLYLSNITGELYPALAKKFNANNFRVERNIRTAIEISYKRTPTEVYENFFGKMTGKASNSEFIATIVNHIRPFT